MEWGELAIHLGLSRSMLDFARKGQRNLSFKALRRLEEAEREAGIVLSQSVPNQPDPTNQNADKKNITIDEMGRGKGIDRDELRRTIEELKRLTADLERIYKSK